MICKLCGEDRPLIRAHIIPESFFRKLRDDEPTLLIVTNNPGAFPKRAPIGVYDQELLCAACEATFGQFDSYGAEVLLNRRDELFKPVAQNKEVLAFSADGIDQELLSMFFVSVLWRAAATSQMFFANIKLGPFQDTAKHVLRGSAPEDKHIFATVLSRWTVSKKQQNLTTSIMNPSAESYDGINAYRLYFGEHVAYIKVDKRPYPEPLKSLQIGAQKTLFVTTRNFDESKELKVMKRVAYASMKKNTHEVQLCVP